MDSFCAEMVREFFHLLDIAPEFKILSDKREQELINESLEEAVSAAYDSGSIRELSDAFAAERDDRRITRMILTLYRFMQSHPFPEKWLNEKVKMYFAGDGTPWERVILEYAAEAAGHAAALLKGPGTGTSAPALWASGPPQGGAACQKGPGRTPWFPGLKPCAPR